MKKASVLACACTLLFLSAAGLAQTAKPAPLSPQALAQILGPPVAPLASGPQQSGMTFAAKGPTSSLKSLCSARANCQYFGSVSCSSNVNSASCSAVDAACPGEPGHVTCDGVTTYCEDCQCTQGSFRDQACCRCSITGECADCGFCAYGYDVQCW